MKNRYTLSFWIVSFLVICGARSAFAGAYDDLEEADQETVKAGRTLLSLDTQEPGRIRPKLFQYLNGVKPIEAAALFYDFDSQADFIPGMTDSRVTEGKNEPDLVASFKFNPSALLASAASQTLPTWMYGVGSFSYAAKAEVNYRRDCGYEIQWASVENYESFVPSFTGKISFQTFAEGTLVYYRGDHSIEGFGSAIIPLSWKTYFARQLMTHVLASFVKQINAEKLESPSTHLDFQIEGLNKAVGKLAE